VTADALADVAGVLVGHYIGTTVVLVPDGTTGAVDQRGGAPGSRETNLLEPENLVQRVDAVCLSGGGAYGLAAADGVLWQIDLANPNQTERAGFTATSAKPGDAIVVLGNRHMDKTQMLMKAVRITVAGRTYDLYPERIRTN